jgi:hypothetical protein
MPWINRSHINILRKEISQLRANIKDLVAVLEKKGLMFPVS